MLELLSQLKLCYWLFGLLLILPKFAVLVSFFIFSSLLSLFPFSSSSFSFFPLFLSFSCFFMPLFLFRFLMIIRNGGRYHSTPLPLRHQNILDHFPRYQGIPSIFSLIILLLVINLQYREFGWHLELESVSLLETLPKNTTISVLLLMLYLSLPSFFFSSFFFFLFWY